MAIRIPEQIVRNLLSGAEGRGLSRSVALERAGIAGGEADLAAPDFVRLVRVVTLTLDDELAGLQERPQRIGMYSIIAAHAARADTLGEAYARTARFMDLLDNTFRVSFRDTGSEALFELTRIPGRRVLNELAVEMVLVLTGRMLGWLSGGPAPLNRAWFDYPQPGHVAAYRGMFPRAPLRFGRGSSGIALPASLMRRPVQRTEAEAVAYARRTPLDAFLPMDATAGLALEVSLAVEGALREEGRLPGMAEIGRAVGLPEHTLRRRLKAEGVDYTDIRNQVRRDMSVRLLTTTTLPVEEIAARTGFSEASAFIRAFRSWTGLTPRAYRVGDFEGA